MNKLTDKKISVFLYLLFTYINLYVNICVQGGCDLNIIHSKTFDSNLKKIKKHKIEYNNLLKILNIIENTDNFKELTLLPQIKMYGFEGLKYQYNDYYSFN